MSACSPSVSPAITPPTSTRLQVEMIKPSSVYARNARSAGWIFAAPKASCSRTATGQIRWCVPIMTSCATSKSPHKEPRTKAPRTENRRTENRRSRMALHPFTFYLFPFASPAHPFTLVTGDHTEQDRVHKVIEPSAQPDGGRQVGRLCDAGERDGQPREGAAKE